MSNSNESIETADNKSKKNEENPENKVNENEEDAIASAVWWLSFFFMFAITLTCKFPWNVSLMGLKALSVRISILSELVLIDSFLFHELWNSLIIWELDNSSQSFLLQILDFDRREWKL